MHFSINRDQLSYAINIVQRAVSNRNPMPIFSCVHLETIGNILNVTATDLEFGIRCSLQVDSLLDGAAALPSKYVSSLMTKLPVGNIDVKCDISSNTTTFNYGNSEMVLNGFPAEEFPLFPELPNKPTLRLNQNIFKRMLKRVLFAVSNDERRPVFTGVNITVDEDGTLSMVATDIRKLAVSQEKAVDSNGQIINIIVPGKTLNEVFKIIDAVDDYFEIYLTDNKVFFTVNNICIMSRLITGQFPNYRIVIPSNFVCELKSKVSDLLDAAERASLLIDTRRNVFNIRFQPEQLLLYFYTESGRIREEITTAFSGDPMDVGFNIRFFIDLLRSMDTEEVNIKISGHESPAIFEPVGDQSYFSILVPAVA
ncbi:DNA polymerase III subunit beta [Desulfotruncus alcoholivorax]|uniref:DNA polymerase III subunit beta n=1 Tax=Desulfotruncus alcoholivorax TaxID=265477 RepID=UPI000408D49C|nr:DNA polymerase III subunit beta [Desulfotruncus alcoholivorax]